jgi:hypothetical protein
MPKRSPPAARRAAADAEKSSVTSERAARLYRLLEVLSNGTHTRRALMRRLRLDIRGFYRDLDTLRRAGITVALDGRHYRLQGTVANAVDLLPFPDPHLTLGDAKLLAKGRTRAHRVLKQQLKSILS